MERIVIDVGNTTIATALFRDDDIHEPIRVSTESVVSSADVVALIDDVRTRCHSTATEVVACVGVARIKTLCEASQAQMHYLSGTNPMGALIEYSTPESLGPDRIANTIAATQLNDLPVVVVDCGTAINIDVINENGAFIGGIIAPGIEISRDALTQYAPALPEVQLVVPEDFVGTDTISCIQSGVLYGAAGMVDSFITKITARYGKCNVVVTGGTSRDIAPLLTSEHRLDEFFTLCGLGFAAVS